MTNLEPVLTVLRWNATTGSGSRSRATVIIGSGEHLFEATGVGDGPVDALFRATDRALHPVLGGHPRLLAYSVSALPMSDGGYPASDARGQVEVRLAPPAGEAEFTASAIDTNILAASLGAYVAAINHLLLEPGWAAAIEAAGNRRRATSTPQRGRATLDPDAPEHDMHKWYQG
jgi:2-isopropylmalate synthase